MEGGERPVGDEWDEAPRPLRFPHERLRLRSVEELKREPSPEWLVDGMLVRSTLAAIVGDPGVCKSFLALGLSLSIAAGREWCGRPVHQGPVVFISAEGHAGLKHRVAAWEQGNACTITRDWYYLPEAVQFLSCRETDALLDHLRGLQPAPLLMVVDTVARCRVGGEENSAKDMGLFIAAVDLVRRETGATVLLIHHSTKAHGGLRGSSALPGALDTIMEVTTGRADRVELECTKQKDAVPFDQVRFTRRVVQLDAETSSLVLDYETNDRPRVGGEVSQEVSRAAIQALDVLRETFGRDGATTTDWKTACTEDRMSERTFFRSKDELVERKLVATNSTKRRGARYIAAGVAQ